MCACVCAGIDKALARCFPCSGSVILTGVAESYCLIRSLWKQRVVISLRKPPIAQISIVSVNESLCLSGCVDRTCNHVLH